ncbi:complex 1 protein [Amylocarpus encephaloides]|uniref:LYR motif-containing protein 2 n=1 Tax=Amylocarpus encephaloides TaxID=45428 RepID=A0A9P8C5G4_9HELO|nr:complex 1 protein [Amylocarpus encephaloides]
MQSCASIGMRASIAFPASFRSSPEPKGLYQCALRQYASGAKRPKRPSRFGKQPIDLDHFILRGRVISLYRAIIRRCRTIPSPDTQAEMLEMARVEFQRQKDVASADQIRYLLSTGKAEFERSMKFVDGL